ncbi:hypothetical protein [Pseudoalteromonas peptidolytica]|uniref:hypothetical protein n=1 Tax=Pseudoalteromonas peptidolytica TaxID=61150 RepID=UPI00298E4E57|nr:hypothetical protein [Pseudoalteromonas peptidolytica]MDW7548204.1 hypothetical protein [Pseudoalteromonas peptidolytica]
MTYCYLFEAKSIQSYLFKTGKLKDMIAASERLDMLVDDNNSVLAEVLEQLGYSHNLADKNAEGEIQFLRCKGAAFSAYSKDKAPLQALRNLWTLTVLQLFPGLAFCDALEGGMDKATNEGAQSLQSVVKLAQQRLAADHNQAKVTLPLAPAIANISQRTGNAQVPTSKLASFAPQEEVESERLDLDTDLHRQAYQVMNLKDQGALQSKYSPNDQTYSYPTNFEKSNSDNIDQSFDFSTEQNAYKGKQNDERKDIALVHIDGNGLGIILLKLNKALSTVDEKIYANAYRSFSEGLASATKKAAQAATQIVVDYGQTDNTLAMRPLVLGGDDVTLLIRADLALPWSKQFCRVFQQASQEVLTNIFAVIKEHGDADVTKDMKGYLSASGGVLFQKANHPFTNSHHVVEGLCANAKRLTKQIDDNVGPAALSFLRLSNTATQHVEEVIKQNVAVTVDKLGTLTLALPAYLIDSDEQYPCLQDLYDLFEVCLNKDTPMTMSKWRQVLTHLSLGNMDEANRIYERAKTLKKEGKAALEEAFYMLSKSQNDTAWYWQQGDEWISPLKDLMVLERFYFKPDEAAEAQ